VGVAPVPDSRLDVLAGIFKPGKPPTPAGIRFVDIAGIVRGAHKGEGLGNQFLAHIYTVDAVAHIVRCFDDSNIIHVDGSVNPGRDIEIVETELILKDLETIERRHSEADKHAKSGDKKARDEAAFYLRVRDHLSRGRLAKYFTTTHDDENLWLRALHLLTNKPVMYICNVHEKHDSTEPDYIRQVRDIAARPARLGGSQTAGGESAKVVVISAEVEAEIAELPDAERGPFLQELGLKESGLSQLIREGYDLLQLITFFTVNPKELHAWTIRKGTTALSAAGVIHTDFEKGFIRAEILKYSDLDRLGSEHAVKEAGLLHVHGRDYIVEDGDVMFVRFNL
jgi:GTP-binding protein YchF